MTNYYEKESKWTNKGNDRQGDADSVLHNTSQIQCLYKLPRFFFHFRMITLVNINGFSPNLVYAFILWKYVLGLLIYKSRYF